MKPTIGMVSYRDNGYVELFIRVNNVKIKTLYLADDEDSARKQFQSKIERETDYWIERWEFV